MTSLIKLPFTRDSNKTVPVHLQDLVPWQQVSCQRHVRLALPHSAGPSTSKRTMVELRLSETK